MALSKKQMLTAIAGLGLALSVAASNAEAGRGSNGSNSNKGAHQFQSMQFNNNNNNNNNSTGSSQSVLKFQKFQQSNGSVPFNSNFNVGNNSNLKKSGQFRSGNHENVQNFNFNPNGKFAKKNNSNFQFNSNFKFGDKFFGNHNHDNHKHHNHNWDFCFGKWGCNYSCWHPDYCFQYVYVPPVVYYNPYCTGIPVGGFDYSQQIPVQTDPNAPQDSELFQAARKAFFEGNLNAAIDLISKAISQQPNNRDMHQFRSLVHFAMGDYRQSTAAAYAALSTGPGWNWTVLRSFYPSGEIYTLHLRALEAFVIGNPQDAAGHFLLGYHYLMTNHADAAKQHLMIVMQLQPGDKLAAQMLTAIGGPVAGQELPPVVGQPNIPQQGPVATQTTNENPPAAGDPTQAGTIPGIPAGNPMGQPMGDPMDVPATGAVELPAQDAANIPMVNAIGGPAAGIWKATPMAGTTIELILGADGKFNWNFAAGENKKSFKGSFTVKGDVLTLVRDNDNDKMEGKITLKGDKSFILRMTGSPKEDPGLTFDR